MTTTSVTPDEGPGAATSPWSHRAPWLILAAAALLFFWRLGDRPLYAPDEGRYGEIGREMLQSGDWIAPTLCGVPYLDKPPLLYWLEASGMALFGKNEFGVRFFVAATALLGVWLVYLFALELYGRNRAVMAAACLATSGLYAGLARILLTDLLLAVSILAAFYFFFRAWRGKKGALGMWIALAASFLAKGPVGPGLFVLGAAPFWLISRPRPPFRTFRPLPGALVFVALALPWTFAIQSRFPAYLGFFYWRENVMALGSKTIHHPQSVLYAPGSVAAGFLPWTLLLPVALWQGFREVRRDGRSSDPGLLLSLCWAATTMAVFTLSVSKLGTYYLPMYPALALLVARMFGTPSEPRRLGTAAFGALALLLAAAALVVPFREPPLHGAWWFAAAAAITGAGAAVACCFFAKGQSVSAFTAVAVSLGLACIPGVVDVRRFDNYRSSRNLLLKHADLLRSCSAVLSDSSPMGMPEWYLGIRVVHKGAPHDLDFGRVLVPSAGQFLSGPQLDAFLATHPRTALLTVLRKREDVHHDYPQFHEVDADEGFLLLVTQDVK